MKRKNKGTYKGRPGKESREAARGEREQNSASLPEVGETEGKTFSHLPVMLNECIDGLNIKPDGIYVDCTAGGGGHSSEIASRLGIGGRLIAIDRDSEAIAACEERLSHYGDRVTLVHDNYRSLDAILKRLEIDKIDGVLMDLGVSSHQIDTAERGFSYSGSENAPLDMRMSQEDGLTAFDVVNGYDEAALKRILFEYGEERFTVRIVREILKARESAPIKTTNELSELIKRAVPIISERGSHPAKRTFQAIRIEVNGELDGIEPALRYACEALNPGGRAAVITFHSLEDRIVKRVFANLAAGCICPPDFPVCVCGQKPQLKLICKKPITAGEGELLYNPRSASAKLRIAEKIL